LFGESAGGISVCMLSASPKTKGMIFAAILESGPCIFNWGPENPENGFK